VRTTLPFSLWLMEQQRFIAGDFSTDFIAEEWDLRNKNPSWHESVIVETDNEDEHKPQAAHLSDEQIAAIVGSLLLHEQSEQQRQRIPVMDVKNDNSSRWRDASRREILRSI